MSIILDLIIVGIILFFVLSSARKGFVKVLIETVGFVVAIVIAFSVSNPLATATYDKFIEPPVISAISSSVEESTGEAVDDKVIDAIPDFIVNSSERFGISLDEMKAKLTASASSNTTDVIKSASQEVVKPIAVKVIGMVFTLILVIILLIVVKILARVINKLFSFSIVGKLNQILGGVLGIVKGCIIAVVVCIVSSLIMSFVGEFFIFTAENVNNSTIYKFIVDTFSII